MKGLLLIIMALKLVFMDLRVHTTVASWLWRLLGQSASWCVCTVEKPGVPTAAFGKLFLKRFGRISLRFAVFWNTFVAFQESLPKPRPRLKSRA